MVLALILATLDTLPAPVLNNGSPAPGVASGSAGSPAPRPGFSRISSVVEADTPKESTPVPAERSKVVIGLGTKRKATTEAQDSPPAKRR